MKSVTTRPATNADGPAVKRLLAATGQDLPVAFDDIAGYWVLAEWKQRAVGCIQVCYGRPIGSVEDIAVDENLSGMIKGHVVRALLLDAMAMLYASGATFTRGFVPFDRKDLKRALKARGGNATDQGNMFIRRIGQ